MEFIRIFNASDLYIILTTILTTLLFQMAIYFFIKWRNYDKKLRLKDQVINLSLSIFFLFWGISNIIGLPYDLGALEARLFVLKIDLLFFVIGAFALIYTLMKILEIKHKKIYLSGLIISILIIVFSQAPNSYIGYYSILSALVLILIIYFTYKITKMVHGTTKKHIIIVMIGLLIFSTSYIRKNFATFFGFLSIFLEDITILNLSKGIDILGMLFISLGFYMVEFAELKWKTSVKNLMVINNGGICLFYYDFTGDKTQDIEFDKQLAAGAFMGIQSILGEILHGQKSEQLEVVDYKGKKVLFKKGNYVNIVLISEQDLTILHEKLQLLLEDIESQFEKYLKDNITKVDLYKPIGYFIEEIFQIKKSKREIIL
ncbi:MAG: hypothetical protein ACTSPY_09075 [Candidatus Helarchaeota archaeon]